MYFRIRVTLRGVGGSKKYKTPLRNMNMVPKLSYILFFVGAHSYVCLFKCSMYLKTCNQLDFLHTTGPFIASILCKIQMRL